MNPTLWLLVTRLQLPLAPRDQGTGCITRRLPAARPPGAGHKGRFVPGVAESGSRRGAGCGPPRALGAGSRGLGQQTGRAVYTGRLLLAREGTGGRRQPSGAAAGRARGGARSLKAPHPVVPGGSPPGCWPEDASHLQTTALAPAPPRRRRAARGATKFLSAQRAAWLTWELGHERAKPEEAGEQERGGPRHGGAPGSAAARAADSAGACGRGAGAEGRGPRPDGRRGRLLWPAPRRHHPSRSPRRRVPGPPLRRLAGRDARGVAARDSPGGRSGQRRDSRCGRDSGSATRPGPRLPRAPANSCQSPPPLPFLSSLRPAGLHFPPLLTPPLLPLSRPPPGCHTVR